MEFLTLPETHPLLFWTLAVLWSTYQGYAGHNYGLYIFDHARKEDSHKKALRQSVYGFHHAAFYFLCTLSGFVSWSLLHSLSEYFIGNWQNLAAGSGALLVTLGAFSIMGISGALPRILYLGKQPI